MQHDCVSERGGGTDTGHVTTEAETSDTATSPGTSAAPEAGRGRQDPPLEPPEGARPWNPSISDEPPGTGREFIPFFFEAPSVLLHHGHPGKPRNSRSHTSFSLTEKRI